MSVGMILLIALLLPVAAAAATLRSPRVPVADAAVRKAPPEMRKPKPAPMPAPAPTDHYARPPGIPPTWKI